MTEHEQQLLHSYLRLGGEVYVISREGKPVIRSYTLGIAYELTVIELCQLLYKHRKPSGSIPGVKQTFRMSQAAWRLFDEQQGKEIKAFALKRLRVAGG